MKALLLLLCVYFVYPTLATTQNSCTPWFPFNKGTSFEYTYFNKKDKVSSRSQYLVKDVQKSGNAYSCTVACTMFDRKDRELSQMEFEAHCVDQIYTVDLANFIDPQFYNLYGDAKMTITGDDLTIPAALKSGSTLPDASAHIEVDMGLKIKIDVKQTNRKVEQSVNVKTPVKEFSTAKVSCDEYMKVPLFTRNGKANYYYAEGYGQVKYESFDKNGKLVGYMLLTKFSK